MLQTIEMTEEQISNLKVFLNRVDLKGIKEAIALVEIIQALNKIEKRKR